MKNLSFSINDHLLLRLQVNTQKKSVSVLYQTSDQRALRPILTQEEFNYGGVEKRLQEMSDSKEELPELLESIQHNGLCVPFQINLRVKVSDVPNE